jgi:PAS domain S-box-containing protein
MAEHEVLDNLEEQRLAALYSYHVLDTLPEKEFDAIARLASYICQTSVAFIAFIDDERQWFKSKVGLEIPEMPRAESWCDRTIMQNDIVEIPDASIDQVYAHQENVTGGFNIRFYASAPLIDPEGYRIGTLCVFDQSPKKLTADQRDALTTLASEVISHLVLRKQKKELEKSLQAHHEFFNLFNSSPELHFIAGPDASIELINQTVMPLLGYTPEETVGKSLWEFVAGKNRDQFIPLIEKAVQTSLPFEIETRTVTRNGEEKWIGWSAVHKNEKWYASGRDVTAQKKVLADLQQLSLVASKVINGVVISDRNDEIIWVNDALTDITGYDEADLVHKTLAEVLKGKPADLASARLLDDAIKKNKSYEVDLSIIRKDGQPAWISVVKSVIHGAGGEIEKYIRVITDITRRKNVEQEVEILSFAAKKSPSGIMIRDSEGRVLWMNESMESIIGYSLQELKDKPLGELLIGPDTKQEAYLAAIEAYRQNKSYDTENLIYKKDGTPVWVYVSNSPLVNEEGKVERQIGVMVDITERKKSQEQLTMLSLVASSTTSGIVINDGNGKVEWVNNAFEKITGYQIDDVRNRRLGDIIKGELTDISIIQKARELSKNKQSFEVDLLAYRKDGQPLWLSVINSVIPQAVGAVDKYVEVIIDITAKKKVEIELIAAKEEALQLSRAKDMFISVMSHEIRTPLNAVIGMSHLLLEDNPHDSQKENLSVLKFSAENLMTLINDVLDFTKIETGNIELEKTRVDLRDLVQSITSSMQYKAGDKSIYVKQEIDAAVPEYVLGDRTRLTQILLNLMGNSVKFTETGGVTIQLKVLEHLDHEVCIRFAVIDTGIGIHENKINTIFESFKQAELDTSRKYGGTGLGLAITKRLIELHGSRINVESVYGKGSTFWFNLTFTVARNHVASNINIVERGLKLHALVVDDNQINRLLINKVLSKWGATVDFATNGLEAVEKIEQNHVYDVVLMDIHMPEMGGLEATEVIRAKGEKYYQQLPIIALTASMLTNQMSEIKDAGMNDYILKPFDPNTLFDKLSKYQKQL